jgi:hypothetical protein
VIARGLPGPRRRALPALVVGVVVVLALIHLPFPFDGDQALFASFAKAMRHGDRLYVDMWDCKQPGIYFFYWFWGSVFGFRDIGIHIGEVVWALGLALCVQRVMRGRVENRWVADVSPLLTVGAFLLAARSWDLTQVEDLVAFPLFVSIWFAAEAGEDARRRQRRLLVSGLAASMVIYFKLMYGVIPVAFWLYLLLDRRRRSGDRSAMWRDARSLIAGFVAPVVPLVVYFAREGLLGTMWWTYVTYPPKIVSSLEPPPTSRLTGGTAYFLREFSWLGVLAAAAIALRPSARRFRLPDADPFMVGMALWFVLGWLTVVVQTEWGYQFMLFVVPLGVFATVGLDRLVTWHRTGRASRDRLALVAFAAAALLLLPMGTLGAGVRQLAVDRLAVTTGDRADFQSAIRGYYLTARLDAAWLQQPGRAPGPIHVEGNPLIYYISGRGFALREHGWAPGESDARLWRWTREELRAQRPVYVFVDDPTMRVMNARSPETTAVLTSMYCRAARMTDGDWYALVGSRECRALP